MNAKEFHDAYGPEIVRQLIAKMGIGMIYWCNMKNGHKVAGKKKALEFARVSAELVGPDAEHLTAIDMMGMRHESAKLVGQARGEAIAKRAARRNAAVSERETA